MAGFSGKHHSEASKAKMSEAKKGSKHPMFGKRTKGFTGKHHSADTRAKMTATRRKLLELMPRKYNPVRAMRHEQPHHIRKPKGERKPFHHSDTTKMRMSLSQLKGRLPTPQTGRDRASKLFQCPEGFERHHIDGNPLNNSPENVMIVTRSQHMKLDGRLDKLHTPMLQVGIDLGRM